MRERARKQALVYGARYLITLVSLYHDSFPLTFAPRWPNPPDRIGEDQLDELLDTGFILCGTRRRSANRWRVATKPRAGWTSWCSACRWSFPSRSGWS